MTTSLLCSCAHACTVASEGAPACSCCCKVLPHCCPARARCGRGQVPSALAGGAVKLLHLTATHTSPPLLRATTAACANASFACSTRVCRPMARAAAVAWRAAACAMPALLSWHRHSRRPTSGSTASPLAAVAMTRTAAALRGRQLVTGQFWRQQEACTSAPLPVLAMAPTERQLQRQPRRWPVLRRAGGGARPAVCFVRSPGSRPALQTGSQRRIDAGRCQSRCIGHPL